MRAPNFKMDLKMPSHLQLKPEDFAAFVGIVIRLNPIPMLGKKIRKQNQENWVSLVSSKKLLKSDRVKEIQRSKCPWNLANQEDAEP